MLDEPKMKNWVRTVMVLAGALLAATLASPGPSGLAFSSSKDGVSFEMKAAFVSIAFDIGQECAKMNTCGRVA
jgi:hypothetical protein